MWGYPKGIDNCRPKSAACRVRRAPHCHHANEYQLCPEKVRRGHVPDRCSSAPPRRHKSDLQPNALINQFPSQLKRPDRNKDSCICDYEDEIINDSGSKTETKANPEPGNNRESCLDYSGVQGNAIELKNKINLTDTQEQKPHKEERGSSSVQDQCIANSQNSEEKPNISQKESQSSKSKKLASSTDEIIVDVKPKVCRLSKGEVNRPKQICVGSELSGKQKKTASSKPKDAKELNLAHPSVKSTKDQGVMCSCSDLTYSVTISREQSHNQETKSTKMNPSNENKGSKRRGLLAEREQRKPVNLSSQAEVQNTNGKLSTASCSCSEDLDHEYTAFMLRITEDILRENLYTSNSAVEKLFASHIDANKNYLDEAKLHERVEELKRELSFPFKLSIPDISKLCECSPSDTSISQEVTPETNINKADTLDSSINGQKASDVREYRVITPRKDDNDKENKAISPKNDSDVQENKGVSLKKITDVEEINTISSNEVSEVEENKSLKTKKSLQYLIADSLPPPEHKFISASTNDSNHMSSKGNIKMAMPHEDVSTESDSAIVNKSSQSVLPKKLSFSSEIAQYKADIGSPCQCSISMQKTALKIKIPESSQDEYVLVDGPICLPKKLLEQTSTVLIQNLPQEVLSADAQSPERVRVSIPSDTKTDYDLTPEKEPSLKKQRKFCGSKNCSENAKKEQKPTADYLCDRNSINAQEIEAHLEKNKLSSIPEGDSPQEKSLSSQTAEIKPSQICPDDFRTKYHFLMQDVSTSMSALEPKNAARSTYASTDVVLSLEEPNFKNSGLEEGDVYTLLTQDKYDTFESGDEFEYSSMEESDDYNPRNNQTLPNYLNQADYDDFDIGSMQIKKESFFDSSSNNSRNPHNFQPDTTEYKTSSLTLIEHEPVVRSIGLTDSVGTKEPLYPETYGEPKRHSSVLSSIPSGRENLKVRYSLIEEDPLNVSVNKFPDQYEIPEKEEVPSSVHEPHNRLKEFTNIDNEDEDSRRFPINDSKYFEIRRLEDVSPPLEETPKHKKKATCCGLTPKQQQK